MKIVFCLVLGEDITNGQLVDDLEKVTGQIHQVIEMHLKNHDHHNHLLDQHHRRAEKVQK